MEKTYNPALIQRTQRYMETHSISQNQFAAKVNLSSAALSSYLNQKYKGSVEAVERQLREFFKLDEEAEAAAEKTASLLPRAAYVPTSISEDVCQSIRFAQLEHCMVVLHGDAGVGKSKGAQKFLRDHPTNAVGIIDNDLVLDDLKTDIVEVKLWDAQSSGAFPAVREECYIEVSSYGGDTTGYQIPFNVHYTGVKTKGTFNPTTKAFTAEA